MTARSVLTAVAVAAAVALVGFSASRFRPGPWYAALDKPAWTPPDWLFAPVWTVLYVAMALAGWRIFAASAAGLGPARGLWLAQLLLNGLWSWLFFGLHLTVLALVDIVALLGVIVALLVYLAPRQPLSFALLAPYGLWVAYALTLNAGVVALNP